METQNVNIKLTAGGKEFTFSVPEGTSYDAAFLAAFQIANHILKLADEAKKNKDEIKKEEEKIVLGE